MGVLQFRVIGISKRQQSYPCLGISQGCRDQFHSRVAFPAHFLSGYQPALEGQQSGEWKEETDWHKYLLWGEPKNVAETYLLKG